MELTKEYIESIALNEQAIKNGKDLVSKGKFVKFNKSIDETLLLGECMGSGKDNYVVSADFLNESKPVFRCTCPSRQFPCKHAIGLLFAYMNGKQFDLFEIPEDILNKREKLEKREEKKREESSDQPKKVNISALVKKIDAQLEGLDLLKQIITDLTQMGLGTMNAKQVRIYEEQARKLGDYYLTGVQAKLREFLYLFNEEQNEHTYTEGVTLLVELNHILNKGKEYLTKKRENPIEYVELNSPIEELLGNTWQLTQLKELGLTKNNVQLIQLAFNSYEEKHAHQFVDLGIWIVLKSGNIYKTMNFRPYRAMKYIKEDDSCFHKLEIKELAIYPGEVNQRVRYEEMIMQEIDHHDYETIKRNAKASFSEVVKSVKNMMKNPLSEPVIYVLLKFSKLGIIDEQFVIENEFNERLILSNEHNTCQHCYFMNQDDLTNQAILGAFKYQIKSGNLEFIPLSIVTNTQIIRLSF